MAALAIKLRRQLLREPVNKPPINRLRRHLALGTSPNGDRAHPQLRHDLDDILLRSRLLCRREASIIVGWQVAATSRHACSSPSPSWSSLPSSYPSSCLS